MQKAFIPGGLIVALIFTKPPNAPPSVVRSQWCQTLAWHFAVRASEHPTLARSCLGLWAVCQNLFISWFCPLIYTWNVRGGDQCAEEWHKALAAKIGIPLELSSCLLGDTVFIAKISISQMYWRWEYLFKVWHKLTECQNLVRSEGIGEWESA